MQVTELLPQNQQNKYDGAVGMWGLQQVRKELHWTHEDENTGCISEIERRQKPCQEADMIRDERWKRIGFERDKTGSRDQEAVYGEISK